MCVLEVSLLPGCMRCVRERTMFEGENDYKAAMTLVMGCKSDYSMFEKVEMPSSRS